MFGSVLTPSLIINATGLGEPNWSKEQPPSYTSSGSCLTEPDKFEDLHLDDHKDTNDEICNEAARVSTGWASASELIISPPSQAYFTGVKSQATVTRAPVSDFQWPQEQTLPVYEPYRIEQTRIEENKPQSDVEATQSSTWWSARWSTTWAQAFGESIATPNPVHFPSDKPHNSTSIISNLNRHTSLTGRSPHKGFHKTKNLLANQLMDRITSMNGSRHTSISSYEGLTQDRRNTYEEAANSFIDCAKTLILRSEGPNQRVDDWMVMGFIDKKYTVPEEGEKKPYLYGEWEYLWAVDEDEIAANNAMLGKDPRAGRTWRYSWTWYRIPTVEDWKWWCGEWRKVPGVIREWKPTEEVWPWQRRYWGEVHSVEEKCEV